MAGTPVVAPLTRSTLQNAAVTALGPYSAVIKRYKTATAALPGLGRPRFVKDIVVIVHGSDPSLCWQSSVCGNGQECESGNKTLCGHKKSVS